MKASARISALSVCAAGLGLSLLLSSCSRSARNAHADVSSAVDSNSRTRSNEVAPTTSPDRLRPRLLHIVPESTRVERNAVIRLTLTGEHFDQNGAGSNTVDIGPIHLTGVPSSHGGRLIEVVLPDRIPSQVEAPPRPILPGTYDVSVSTASGTSNALPLRVLP